MSHEVVLDIRNVHVALPQGSDRPYAVKGFSLQLHQSETLCLVGESGSGKSLAAKAIMGLLPAPHVYASDGEILFNDEDLLKITLSRLRKIRGKEISMIFQEPMTALNPLLTIGDQINEVLLVHTDQSKKQRHQQILDLMNDVDLPDPESIFGAYPHQLSGGQRQRAMIAMALILDPKILIADEPTTALDVTTEAQILRLIRRMQQKHQTAVLFITHDFGVVAEIAHRVAVMKKGELVEFDKSDKVLLAPQHEYTKSLIAAVPSLEPKQKEPKNDTKVMLAIKDLSKIYRTGGGLFSGGREIFAANNVTLKLYQNETLGIVGESGSGKSTVARCIVRLIVADGGKVFLDGSDILALSKKHMRPYRKQIQMIFQDPFGSLNPRYKVGRLIAEGLITHGTDSKSAYKRAHELLELVGLGANVSNRYPHEFSGGQRQRIGIARALALEPKILIADEAVSALDVSVQAQILQLLDEIRERLNLSMLFITHDLRVAAQVCDRILVMRQGKVVEQATTESIFSNPQHPYTKELFASVPGKNWQVPRLQD